MQAEAQFGGLLRPLPYHISRVCLGDPEIKEIKDTKQERMLWKLERAPREVPVMTFLCLPPGMEMPSQRQRPEVWSGQQGGDSVFGALGRVASGGAQPWGVGDCLGPCRAPGGRERCSLRRRLPVVGGHAEITM